MKHEREDKQLMTERKEGRGGGRERERKGGKDKMGEGRR